MSKRNKGNNDSIVEEDKERTNGDSSARMYGHAQHRRSKRFITVPFHLTLVFRDHLNFPF